MNSELLGMNGTEHYFDARPFLTDSHVRSEYLPATRQSGEDCGYPVWLNRDIDQQAERSVRRT